MNFRHIGDEKVLGTASVTTSNSSEGSAGETEISVNNHSLIKKPVPLCSLSNVQLRFLCPSDIDEVRELCQDWFPVDYPYSWYEDITSSSRFYSLAAVYNGVIIGLIVAEIKPYVKLNREKKEEEKFGTELDRSS
ncbi:hypothetical protein RUM44_004749 [Polyplax serrata]|uniref:histone acetyltransferase n=1 Tax=Polyplax serrata TaxID=468196 RepID=A0ABR1B4G1_POLSC